MQSGRQAHVRGGRFSLRRLWRDDAGTTAIEFAFIALGLVYFIVGIVEFAMAMTVGNSLEAATNLSSRLGKTGYVDEEAELSQEQTIMDEVERRVGPMIDMEKLEITHEVFNDFKSLTSPDLINDINGDGDTEDAGKSGRTSMQTVSRTAAVALELLATSSSTRSPIPGRSSPR